VSNRDDIEIELVKLADGGRLLRLSQSESGLALERKLDPLRPVAEQKKQLLHLFQGALSQAGVSFA